MPSVKKNINYHEKNTNKNWIHENKEFNTNRNSGHSQNSLTQHYTATEHQSKIDQYSRTDINPFGQIFCNTPHPCTSLKVSRL